METPVERFVLWRRQNGAKIEKLKAEYGLSDEEYDYRVGRLDEWLIRFEHSPKARKKNWYRFLRNCLPNNNKIKPGSAYHGCTPKSKKRAPSTFTGEPGERKI